jgi:clan AA aspartic protease (TIGR02281 family)
MPSPSQSEFRFNTKTSVIIVDVLLEGISNSKQKIRMALDTGATYTMIPWNIADTLGLEPKKAAKTIEIITASGVEKAPILTLKSMVVFGKRIEGVQVVVHNLPMKSYVDGLLGLSSLVQLKLQIDFDKGLIIV